MTHDTIVMYEDHADEIEPTIHLRGTLDYLQFLAHYWMQRFGTELPEVPDEPGQNAIAVVNHGRWIAGCAGCYNGLPLSRNHNVTICPRCGSGGWANVLWPANRDEIERELLKQPGHRLFAPFRNWVPSWSIEFLRQRTEAANRQLREGVANPRAASIGTPRIWSVGEILTASNMNTFLSEIDRDLIGINGAVELLHGVRPGSFTTAQIAALTGIPNGTMVYNQTLQTIQLMIGDTARAFVQSHTSDLFAAGEIVTVTHGLGVAPTRFQLAYERIGSSAEHGHNNGERVYVNQTSVDPGWGVFDVTDSEYKVAIPIDPDLNVWVIEAPELWKINATEPDDDGTGFGLQGAPPAGLGTPEGIAYYDNALWVVDTAGEELWKINPSNPGDTSGTFGEVGNLPSGLTGAQGIVAHDDALWVVDTATDDLWKINPTNPDDTTGTFGSVGNLPSGLGDPEGVAYGDSAFWVIDGTSDTLWKIDPTNPSNTADDFGNVGSLPSTLVAPNGISYYGGVLWVIEDQGNAARLWKIDPTSPSNIAGEFGIVGALDSNVTEPRGITVNPANPIEFVLSKTTGEPEEITVDNDASAGGWGARLLAFA